MQDYRSYNDVLIRIRSAIDNKDGRSRHPVEAQINGSGSWRGQSVFEFAKLDPGTQLKQEYGTLLGQQLLNPSIARALEQAGVGQGKYVRIRLLLDDDADVPHFIRWERMYFRVGTAFWPVAISPTVPFSRYIPDERPATEPPRDPVFRLLFVIANPKGLPEQQTIDVETEIAHLLDEFQRSIPSARFRITILAGRTALSDTLTTRLKHADWLLAGGNATLDNIGTWLHRDGGYHALHIVCHGNYFAGEERGVLALEDDAGALQEIEDYQLASWIHNRLQLVVFQACRTAAAVPEDSPPFTAIAPKVVRFGIPAVVAMQDFILMSDARAFSAAFYRSLLRDGDVDAAVNEGRQAVPNAVERVDSTIRIMRRGLSALADR